MPLLPRGSRVDCGVSDSRRGAEAAAKNATRKLYFWVYREVCSERTALAPVILCQNRPAHNDTSRTLRPSDCVRCRCAWWFWNFCGGVGGSAGVGVGEVVFWLVLGAGVGLGLGCGGEIDDDDEEEDLAVSGAGSRCRGV